MNMRKARRLYKLHFLAKDGDRSYSFRRWARTLVAARSLGFVSIPEGKLGRITRCAKP